MLKWRCIFLLAAVIPCSSQTPAFEVASVKPTRHGRVNSLSVSGDPATPSPVTFEAINNSLDELIRWAYDVKEYQVSGPRWLNEDSECFDIEARIRPGTPKAQQRLMLQTLLEERFKLALHRETRMSPVYELAVAKGGPKLDPEKADKKVGISYEGTSRARLSSENATASALAARLSERLRHPVIDKTGITTHFSFSMEYRNQDDDTTRPAVFEALQEKLGLSLKLTKGPVEVLVIDHIEKLPAEN